MEILAQSKERSNEEEQAKLLNKERNQGLDRLARQRNKIRRQKIIHGNGQKRKSCGTTEK